MKKILLSFSLLSLLTFGGCTKPTANSNSTKEPQKIKIVVTLFPLYDFAKNVGGDFVEVSLLLPPGAEAHSFEPKPSDILKINEADIFIYTGKQMEPWAEDILQGINNSQIKVLDAGTGIDLEKTTKKEEPAHEHEEITHEHHHGEFDPHIWLDFENSQKIVSAIAKTLIEKNSNNEDTYKQNADEYNNKLVALDEKYKSNLKNCQSRKLIHTGHFAFGYLTKRYNLQYESAYGISPDSEPSAKDLANLIEQIKKNKTQAIFFEELFSQKVAQMLSKETGAKLLPLNPAHNLDKDGFENGATFISIMENNLKSLISGLICSSEKNETHNENDCTKYAPEKCPSHCTICPPCAECSSISCQSEEFCKKLSFDKEWHKNISK